MTFAVGAGEVVAVIGPNGAGKTTLLEAIVGILPLAGGQVRYRGAAISRFSERAATFAFMSDAGEPPAEVRVGEFVDGVHARRTHRADDQPLLAALGLRHLRRARIADLSRGEKRRLLLFGALSCERPVIVLDEALGVFDPLQLIDVLRVIRERAAGGGSFLMSVHQMADAEKIASRVVLLDSGRILAAGSLGELRQQAGWASASLEEVFLRILQNRVGHAAP